MLPIQRTLVPAASVSNSVWTLIFIDTLLQADSKFSIRYLLFIKALIGRSFGILERFAWNSDWFGFSEKASIVRSGTLRLQVGALEWHLHELEINSALFCWEWMLAYVCTISDSKRTHAHWHFKDIFKTFCAIVCKTWVQTFSGHSLTKMEKPAPSWCLAIQP
mgnify:CR=1 FL=1